MHDSFYDYLEIVIKNEVKKKKLNKKTTTPKWGLIGGVSHPGRGV